MIDAGTDSAEASEGWASTRVGGQVCSGPGMNGVGLEGGAGGAPDAGAMLGDDRPCHGQRIRGSAQSLSLLSQVPSVPGSR